MSDNQCKTCNLVEHIKKDVEQWINEGQGSKKISYKLAEDGVFISKDSIRRHRRNHMGNNNLTNTHQPLLGVVQPPKINRGSSHMDLGPDGGTFDGIESTTPITNWSHVFTQFKLNPNDFEIIGDTVRVSVWNNGRIDDETGNLTDLYSYKATFRKKVTTDNRYTEDLISNIRSYQPSKNIQNDQGKTNVTAVIGLADWQLGKGEGDGTPGTVRRILSSLESTEKWIESVSNSDFYIERILLANLGDHTEATHGSYSNQPATVDLNLRDQINTAIELNMKWITTMRNYAPVQYVACLCNHGQLSRIGHDPVMGDADNATGLIGDQLQHICSYVRGLHDVTFTIPKDEMVTKATVSGVNIAMAHGHKITGKEETWLAQQSQALVHREQFITDLWFTAHKHHASIVDLGPYTRIQATTEDPGSKWLLDSKGVYSTPGTTVFLVGKTLPMKWTKYEVLT